MFVFASHNNCSPDDVNFTRAELNSHFREQEFYLMVCILPVAIIAGFANALSLYIFAKQRFESQAVRFSLICISVSEVAMLSAVAAEGVIVLVGIEGYPFLPYTIIASTIHVSLNSTFCVRNWNVVLIAAARCEVVYRPLTSRHRRLFSVRCLKVAQVVLLGLSMLLALLNNLLHRGLVCNNAEDIVVQKKFLAHFNFFAYYELYGIFMFQSCLPVVLITLFTISLFAKLHISTPSLNAYSGGEQHNGNRTSKLSVPQMHVHRCSHSNMVISAPRVPRQRVSYLVLILSFVFCLLEMPTFIITCVLLINPKLPYAVHPNIFCNVLNVLDSLLNFFIYAFSSRRFRQMAKETVGNIFCPKCVQHQQRRLTASYNMQGTFISEHTV